LNNFYNDGIELTYTPTSAVTSGSIVQINGIVGVNNSGISAADLANPNIPAAMKLIALNIQGVYDLTYRVGDIIDRGDVVYLSTTPNTITSDISETGIKVGTAWADHTAKTVLVNLNKFFG